MKILIRLLSMTALAVTLCEIICHSFFFLIIYFVETEVVLYYCRAASNWPSSICKMALTCIVCQISSESMRRGMTSILARVKVSHCSNQGHAWSPRRMTGGFSSWMLRVPLWSPPFGTPVRHSYPVLYQILTHIYLTDSNCSFQAVDVRRSAAFPVLFTLVLTALLQATSVQSRNVEYVVGASVGKGSDTSIVVWHSHVCVGTTIYPAVFTPFFFL
jgi:hypothetical protein